MAGTTSTQPAGSSTDPADDVTRTAGGAGSGGRRLHVFGVRHHGPGSARSVLRALDEVRPAVVLVELPVDCESVLRWIADPELVGPVALLATLVADPGRAAFWPLAEFSPEWQAVRWALEHEVPVRPIDVPAGWVLSGQLPGDWGDDTLDVAEPRVSDPLAALAAAAGDSDAERWWEDVVEHRGDGTPAFEAVGEAMTAVRDGTFTSPRDATREAHMRRAIRLAVAEHDPAPVAVICGAWHVPALDPTATTAAADAKVLKGLGRPAAASRAAITWVPWSDRRLQRASGYGAGVAYPGWYRHVFAHPGPEGVSRFFVDAATALRRHGLAASPDHLIGASRLADALAALRGRPRAGLAEVLDSAGAVLADGAHVAGRQSSLADLLDELTIGDGVGSVPPSAPQVPLVKDVAAAQRAARLKPESAEVTIELDLRTPNGLRRSHLLHRLAVLGVDWGMPDEGRGTRGTFRETWTLRWDAAMAIRLVECSPYGTTLVDAASAMLVERARNADRLPVAAGLVQAALLADLPAAVGDAAAALGTLAANAPDVADLVDALPPLANALRYGDVRGSDSAALATVVDELVVRVIAGLDLACRSLDDDAATAMTERLSSLQGALAVLDHQARRRDLPEVLAVVADSRTVHGLVRGRATRLLHDAGWWTPSDVSARVGRALTAGTPAADGARFVEGFLAGSGTVLVHDAELRGVVDAWISSMSHDGFADAVALLRRTFGAFEPAERRQIGALIRDAGGPHTAAAGTDLDHERVLLGMTTVRHLLGLPVDGGQ